jgi:hypothetical protein
MKKPNFLFIILLLSIALLITGCEEMFTANRQDCDIALINQSNFKANLWIEIRYTDNLGEGMFYEETMYEGNEVAPLGNRLLNFSLPIYTDGDEDRMRSYSINFYAGVNNTLKYSLKNISDSKTMTVTWTGAVLELKK